jgi:catechol 2,3-dioxygenase-like lactoylglutathione lyase family enzyme
MRGVRLDHATINTADVGATVAFFGEYLGLQPGFRPDFGFPGAWLYPEDGDYPIVHLIGVDTDKEPGGNFDHIAFRGVDMKAYVDLLRSNGQPFTVAAVAETPLSQVQHFDPNGVKIEVTFEEPLPTHV